MIDPAMEQERPIWGRPRVHDFSENHLAAAAAWLCCRRDHRAHLEFHGIGDAAYVDYYNVTPVQIFIS